MVYFFEIRRSCLRVCWFVGGLKSLGTFCLKLFLQRSHFADEFSIVREMRKSLTRTVSQPVLVSDYLSMLDDILDLPS